MKGRRVDRVRLALQAREVGQRKAFLVVLRHNLGLEVWLHLQSNMIIILFLSVSDPDPYHLAGSGSVSDDTDPGSAKNLPKP